MFGELFLDSEASKSQLLHVHSIAHHVADEGLLVHSGIREGVEELVELVVVDFPRLLVDVSSKLLHRQITYFEQVQALENIG